ncbi:aspartate transaminase [Synechocystis sp. PCC 6803]|uniref:Aspartate transaminase n=1 Tax=Synechocystis sp. (strain ATCC 27184 / PCC 6803 / Kazusa) TaxID=1111708 RepID=P72859_SYNY3|nr:MULTISPECIES: LL-diaminopimelate aminotransferase [unclassified Synechocystis]BAM50586.1 succinyldiaminopimelate transaminase [Synechocystis sp. PCC 6803] [Bacillus subtilis BEST7613]AGF50564.1 aspartate transaminase [Synechocystis sp. PCC 6803]ALJ66641.1 succinyldiaminopimelate aminotransferase [Synechocystis sp. PCC 6803]AVP88484.1 pyridoxal phosphate-dependent aminotransferase [Synechocystis sp. IPPAS B-1465]MBD2617163.1 LL-diaminopimelate aminotransferase [Synechocystis sp. FACHB-898]
MQFADRLNAFGGNVFADMDLAKAQARAQGQTIIDLSLGSSDLPTPAPILATIAKALEDPSTHGYLLHQGTLPLRQAIAVWYEKRFGLAVDAETEVLPLIGSQEGTAHLPLAVLNPGDVALLMDPGYPSHMGGVYLAGGEIYPMALRSENQFLPVFTAIPNSVLAKAKMTVLSYPHNPTTAIASLEFFQTAVQFCRDHDLVLVHDFPYMDLVFDGIAMPPSVLQADRQKSCAIEFFTFSKSYNMGGFRIGFAIGNIQLISALKKIKAVVDFNQYAGILQGAIAALESPPETVQQTVQIFAQRRATLIDALAKIGWAVPLPTATMYVWAPLPESWLGNSLEFCQKLVAKTGVALSPGSGFGAGGEGYVRFALVQEPDILATAAKKIGQFLDQN